MVATITTNFNWSATPGSRPLSRTAPVYAKVPLVEKTAQTAIDRTRGPLGANLSSRTVTALSLTDVSASFARHVLQAVPSVGPQHSSVHNLGILSSGIGLLLGSAVTVGNGIAELNKSMLIGDGEGIRRAGSQVFSGAVSTNSSALYLAHETTMTAVSSVGIAANALYGIGSLINMGISGVTLYRCACFRSHIDGLLESKKIGEKERIIKTLEFLKEKITPTEAERKAIAEEVDQLHPTWTSQQKLSEIHKKMVNLAEVKVLYVKRRTSQQTAEKLLKDVDKYLAALNGPEVDPKKLKAAMKLINEVKDRNKKKILLTAVILVTSLIAFTALVIGTFFSLGTLPFVLYAISSAIALAILLYPMASENLGKSKAVAMETRAVAMLPLTVVNSSH